MIVSDLNKMTEHHLEFCRTYRDYIRSAFPNIDTAERLEDVPYLPVRAFKEFDLKSIPEDSVFKVMRSSGTTGQFSKIFLDKETAQLQTRALVNCFAEHFGGGRFPMLVIDSERTVSELQFFSARTAGINGFSMFARGRCFALSDRFEIDVVAIRDFLQKNEGKKIFIFGFTALIWKSFILPLRDKGIDLDLSNTFIVHGGGWKKLENEKVSPDTFKETISKVTGCNAVHNYYGMVEQTGTIFIECEHGYMHASKLSDALVRDPRDHRVLGPGEKGLIQVFSAIQKSYPGHSILTEDIGRFYPGSLCGCGREETIVEIEGRARQAEVRGCSDAYS